MSPKTVLPIAESGKANMLLAGGVDDLSERSFSPRRQSYLLCSFFFFFFFAVSWFIRSVENILASGVSIAKLQEACGGFLHPVT